MIIMAEKQKLRAPSGMAGLVKYDDDDKSLIKIKPVHVIEIAVGLIALEVVLFLMFPL
jgi:preprotein translocase subunit Sec61beta